MKPLNDLDEQMKNEESTKLNFITPAIQKKWNAEGDRIVMNTARKVLDIILLMGRFLSVLTEL